MDIARPSTWKAYSRQTKTCVGCAALCCSLPVVVTVHDLVRLGLVASDAMMESPRRIARPLIASGTLAEVRPWEHTYLLGKRADGACIFLGSDRRCQVYEQRPDACRGFPEQGPRPGYCPQDKVKTPRDPTALSRRGHRGPHKT